MYIYTHRRIYTRVHTIVRPRRNIFPRITDRSPFHFSHLFIEAAHLAFCAKMLLYKIFGQRKTAVRISAGQVRTSDSSCGGWTRRRAAGRPNLFASKID